MNNRHPGKNEEYFDKLAEKYDQQIPQHVRQYLCVKKTDIIINNLANHFPTNPTKLHGLDCGCGTGWHVKRLLEQAIDVAGVDISEAMIRLAISNNGPKAHFRIASTTHLPFTNSAFDFVYYINVIHHLTSQNKQNQAFSEARRVLKEHGYLYVFDMNVQSLLFRIYMNYIFPRTNQIDHDQDEKWLPANYYKNLAGWKLIDVKYFTIIPNIVPRVGFQTLVKIEEIFEKYTSNRVGAHYCISLQKNSI